MTDMVGSNALIPNPALKQLLPLIGEWQTTGTHPYIFDITLQGRAVYEWSDGGAFLRIRTHIDHPKFPDSVAIIGSDDDARKYYMIYFDERGVSRKYDVAITTNRLTWWRDDVRFSQRFTLDIGTDKLLSRGEMIQSGGTWEKDLSLAYTPFRATT